MKRKHTLSHIIITVLLLYLLIPLIGTFLFSIATKWQTTVFPEGFTFKWYLQMVTDVRFLESVARSFAASGLSVAASIAVMVPAIFLVEVYFPALDKYLSILVTIPFAIPGVIFAVGLMKIYSSGPLPIAGTLWILIAAYFVIILPYTYQAVRNSLLGINAGVLMEAAEMLHASKLQAFLLVILPNIFKGVMISALLSFSILFGEFVITNLLAGGSYETIQVYMFAKRAESGHLSSAIVITYFVFILLLSALILRLGKFIDKHNYV